MSILDIDDILKSIFNWINDAATYKIICLVSKQWYYRADDEKRSKIDYYSNHLWTLITKFPMKSWSWKDISCSNATTFWYINKFPDAQWYWNLLIHNRNITINDIMNIPEEYYNINRKLNLIRMYKKVTKEDIDNYHNVDWNWEIISQHATINILETYISYNSTSLWNTAIINNPNVSLKYIEDHFDLSDRDDFNWYEFSRSEKVTWDFISRFPQLSWHYPGLSCNPNITFQNVLDTLEKEWSWDILFNRGIMLTEDNITNYSRLFTNWYCISRTSKITWNFVKNNTHFHWDYRVILLNSNIGWEDIKQMIDHEVYKKFNISSIFSYISQNPNITLDIVLSNFNYEWDWESLSQTLKLTWRIVEKYKYLPWNWKLFVLNTSLTHFVY